MIVSQWLMTVGTTIKIAPLTENGNNCPTSEQAQNQVVPELWPPFPGSERVKEVTQPRFRMFRANAVNQPPTKKPRPGKQRPYLQHILRKGRKRGIPMKSDVARPPMVLAMSFVLGAAGAGLLPARGFASAAPSRSPDVTPPKGRR